MSVRAWFATCGIRGAPDAVGVRVLLMAKAGAGEDSGGSGYEIGR